MPKKRSKIIIPVAKIKPTVSALPFVNYILLPQNKFDIEAIKKAYTTLWGEDLVIDEKNTKDNQLVFFIDKNPKNGVGTIVFSDKQVPNEDAQFYATNNYLWDGAVSAAQNHTGFLLVSFIQSNQLTYARYGVEFAKIVASCVLASEASGIYIPQTVVLEPLYYLQTTKCVIDGGYPTLALVWLGVNQNENNELELFSLGLEHFGLANIYTTLTETFETKDDFIYSFYMSNLYGVIEKIIVNHMKLRSNSTVDFGEEVYKVEDFNFESYDYLKLVSFFKVGIFKITKLHLLV